MNAYYPMIVDLTGRRCVVAGGGPVAERKIAALLDTQASVVAISPGFTEQITAWIQEHRVEGIARKYVSPDADNAFLLIAATDDERVNVQVHQDAVERKQLVNVADRPELCSFIVPAVVRRGKLLIAVSTSGASPSAALQIRNEMEAAYGVEYEIYLDFLSEFRLKVQQVVKDTKHRRQLFKDILQVDLLHKIRSGEFERFTSDVLGRLERQRDEFKVIE